MKKIFESKFEIGEQVFKKMDLEKVKIVDIGFDYSKFVYEVENISNDKIMVGADEIGRIEEVEKEVVDAIKFHKQRVETLESFLKKIIK